MTKLFTIDWPRAKEITDVIVPWLTIAGLFAAGGYTLFQYRQQLQERRQAATMEYVAMYAKPPLSDHRAVLASAWDEAESTIIGVLTDASLTPREVNDAYTKTILNIVSEPSARLAVEEELLYFDQLMQCIQLELCDTALTHATMQSRAREFFRQYFPYICALRKEWRDRSTGAALEAFVRNSNDELCLGELTP